MFDDLENNGDSYRRRQLAGLLGAVSLLLLIAVYVWHTLNATPDDYVLFEAIPMNPVEMGLVWGALLGVLLAICLFGFSLIRQRRGDGGSTRDSRMHHR